MPATWVIKYKIEIDANRDHSYSLSPPQDDFISYANPIGRELMVL